MLGMTNCRAASALGLAALLLACGDSPAPHAPPEGYDAGDEPGLDGGSGRKDAGDAATDPAAPQLAILAPAATDDPASEDVLVGSSVKVRCEAKPGTTGEVIDPASVQISAYADEDTMAFVTKSAQSTSELNVFEAELPLTDSPHGAIRIECTAEDVAAKPHAATASLTTLNDRGPAITFISPVSGDYVSADAEEGEDVRVTFRVAPQPLGPNDDGAEINDVSVSVIGKPLDGLMQNANEPNVYSFGLDFNDKTRFPVLPNTLDVLITASNQRAMPATATARLTDVGVDSEGPTIALKSPTATGDLPPVVSGKVDVVLEVKDALSGVDPDSVEVLIEASSSKKSYAAMLSGVDRYEMTFQTNEYPNIPRLALTVSAKDHAGILSTQGFAIDVDTIPPWISMTPPDVRQDVASMNQCSGLFDPVGDLAVNDGQVTAQAYRPRAVIWDRPLQVSGQSSVRYALIDETSAQLFVQHNVDTPLIIDTDKDGTCDSINASPADTTKRPTALQLKPITPAGVPPIGDDLNMDPKVDGTDPTYTSTACMPATQLPGNYLCSDSEMKFAPRHSAEGVHAIIFAYQTAKSGLGCTGTDYVAPRAGWACLAVQARDNAGNLGLSMPVRVCSAFDPDPMHTDPIIQGDCGADPGNIVSVPANITCTDGCTMPDWFTANPSGTVKAMPRVIRIP